MYRLYVDEVGTDDLTNLHDDKHRYLSLTGLAMEVNHARDELGPKLDWIKKTIFNPDPDDPPINLHRKDIMGLKGVFGILRDEQKRDLFDRSIIRVIEICEYSVVTAVIDKEWMLRQRHWKKNHPYHYLMEILVEKYTRFLERKNDIGDIMPEARMGKKDATLQNAFEDVKASGTQYVQANRIARRIPSKKLKFRTKKDNIAGLQLCDLIAHPSHIHTRQAMYHDVTKGPFAHKICCILEDLKYDRSSNGRVLGYGIKRIPPF